MRLRRRFVALTGLLAFFFIVFVVLGTWQVYRYGVRLRMGHAIAARVHAPPVPPPGRADWPRIRAGHLQFLHVGLDGHFIAVPQTLVYGTSRLGYGYWVIAPFQATRGFIVLVNRGWISQNLPEQPAFAAIAAPTGHVRVTGLLRPTEPGGGFLRRNRPKANRWYSRDVIAIAAKDGLATANVAPYFIDADRVPGAAKWPAAGLAVVAFYNESNWYAVIWYLLAAGMLLGGAIVVRYERRMARRPQG